MKDFDAIIIGAGAAGLMCAIAAGRRGKQVAVLDHANKIGEKIRISGGGRCNFTNLNAGPENYVSQNPRFCVSALSRFTPDDFLGLTQKHAIEYTEKSKGQLFCQGSATQIIDMLVAECTDAGATLKTGVRINTVSHQGGVYGVQTDAGDFKTPALVIATGGLSIPKIGATDFAHRIAEQFGLELVQPRAGLVPLTFDGEILQSMKALAGVSVDCTVRCNGAEFSEALLFTHRGLSGPAILQISSYWREDDAVQIDLAPEMNVFAALKTAKQESPKQMLQTVLASWLPRRLAQAIVNELDLHDDTIAQTPDNDLQRLGTRINAWALTPSGSEGYRTAEVTLGGVDTRELSSKTFEAAKAPGLYFIGEAVDVTGQLGGYNFQWAWASGWAAGESV